MAKKKKGKLKKLGKLGLAILEHRVGKVIGNNAVDKLKAEYKEQKVLIKAVANTEERYSFEFPHTDTRTSLLDLPISTVPEFKEAISDFYRSPNDPKLANVLRQQLSSKYRKLLDEEINTAVEQYIDILTEELAIHDEKFRENIRGLSDIQSLKVLRRIEERLREIGMPAIPTPTTLPPLHQLPAPPADFTGRQAELAELLDKIKEGGVTITGVRGMGGIGKTALALVLAERLKEDYPDAQFYLDLRGASEEGQVPVTTQEALAHVIRAYHPEADLPESEEELQALHNSVLNGQRALLLMDNALDAAQVGPLIPPPGNALLVTSRQKFALPGLYAKDLDTLPPEEARALVQRIAPRVDDACADEIAKLCGCLPAALRLAATALAETIDLKPETYLEDLREEKERLALVDASLSLSAKLLEEDLREFWYALGVFPESFDRDAAAAVWGVEEEATQENLSTLVRYSLVDWDEASWRYKLHDLARVYAKLNLREKELELYQLNHADHYQKVLNFADDLYQQGGDSLLLGLTIFDLERNNIESGHSWAKNHAGKNQRALELCNDYPAMAYKLLPLRQRPHQRISWLETALEASLIIRNKEAQGWHLGNLGIAYAALGDPKTAIRYHEQGLEIAIKIDDRRGEGQELGNLGNAHGDLGDPKTAIRYYEQALEIAREFGDRRMEGNSLRNLGTAHGELGDPKTAIKYLEQSLEIAREIGDRRGEGNSLSNLGIAHGELGDHKTAIKYYEQALEIAREIGDRIMEGNSLGSLGNTHFALGDPKTAIQYYEQHLEITREIGDLRNEGTWLGNLGNVHANLGDPKKAIKYHEQALEIAREIGDRRGEALSSWNLGLVYEEQGQIEKAIEVMQICVDYEKEIGHPDAEEDAAIVEELKKGLE